MKTLRNYFEFLSSYFLPAALDSYEEKRKAVLLVHFILVISIFSFIYLVLCYYTDIIVGVWTNIIMLPLLIMALFVFKRTKSFVRSSNIAVLGLTAGISEGVLFSGLPKSPAILWLMVAPSISFLLGNKKAGIQWTIIVVIVMLVFGVMSIFNFNVPYLFPVQIHDHILTFTLIAVTAFIAIIINIYDNTRTAATNAIAAERAKSDSLLLNILPQVVADELKEKNRYEARSYDNVSVLFTDIVGFSKISKQLSPDELVEEIHICFKAFDEIMDHNGLEKIKTIGDSYMAAAGVPEAKETHARDAVNAAMQISLFIENRIKERKAKGKIPFEVRIGVHSGPVVAGIVGVKKFAYDIWGDTVNLASRMESGSESGKVNISGATYELVKNYFNCHYRGKITAKNMGEIDMYFVE